MQNELIEIFSVERPFGIGRSSNFIKDVTVQNIGAPQSLNVSFMNHFRDLFLEFFPEKLVVQESFFATNFLLKHSRK